MDHQYAEMFEGHSKKISCKHEIVFNITATVLSEDDKGEDAGYEEICTKHYHIPVKDGADYKQFMDSFFQFLEGCLSSSAKKTYEKDEEDKHE
jgi:hypothetical protein